MPVKHIIADENSEIQELAVWLHPKGDHSQPDLKFHETSQRRVALNILFRRPVTLMLHERPFPELPDDYSEITFTMMFEVDDDVIGALKCLEATKLSKHDSKLLKKMTASEVMNWFGLKKLVNAPPVQESRVS